MLLPVPQGSPSTDDSSESGRPDDEDATRLGVGRELDGGGETGTVKYVDNTTTIEKVPPDRSIKHFSTTRTLEAVEATGTSSALATIINQADDMKMKVNCAKTQLLCISGDNGCKTTAAITAGGHTIRSTDLMKLLGFMLDEDGGVNTQVEMIQKKFRARFWSLIHLRKSGFKGCALFSLYKTFVRPIIETNSVIYHSMLTINQRDCIERLQKVVTKLCFGYDDSYAKILTDHGIETLEERRIGAVKKFVAKALANDRFRTKWFIPRPAVETNLRTRKPFIENRARTSRYMKSPLVAMQKVANQIYA